MKNLGMLASIALCLCAMIPQALGAKESRAKKPNIILCMTDDQGWGDTGYNGHPHLKTPNLDKMAAEGVRFDRFYSAAPVCSPTRGSCLTGRHPFRYGITYAMSGHMKKEELTLYEALKAEGYATGHFGKWHIGTLTPEMGAQNRWGGWSEDPVTHYSPPWENSVDTCFVTESKVPTWNPMITPANWKGKTTTAGGPFGNDYFIGEDKIATDNLEGDDSRLIMDRALPFIKNAVADDKPFLAVVWFHAPHLPVVAGPKYLEMYKDQSEQDAHYYGCITAMDEQVGRLRETLDEIGVSDNTMLWFCSDNGPAGNDKSPGKTNGLKGRKGGLNEGGVRVPGLLVWPGKIKSPKVVTMPACTIDYVPTIYDMLGIAPQGRPEPVDGISILPAIFGDMTERSRPIGFESGKKVALTDNRYKLYRSNPESEWELYDLIEDPGEQENIAESHPEIVKEMQTYLENWRQSCKESLAGEDY